MKYEYELATVLKLGDWAANLPDDIDFIDYWYNLAMSGTKAEIESDFMNSINAFHWTVWQDRFEELTDSYRKVNGEGFAASEREWFANYTQYLVYAFQVPSSYIAKHYGRQFYIDIMNGWTKYHTLGVDQFVDNIVAKYGMLPNVTEVVPLHM